MLENVPAWLGNALRDARAGHAGLAVARLGGEDLLNRDGFRLRSPAFDDGEDLDPSFTADEEDAVAPPLEWSAPPPGTRAGAQPPASPGEDVRQRAAGTRARSYRSGWPQRCA